MPSCCLDRYVLRNITYTRPLQLADAHRVRITHAECVKGVAKGGSSSRVGFNVPPNIIIGHIGDDFLRVRWPNQQCQALKDNSWSVHQVKGQSHQAKPVQGKVK